MHEQNNKKIEKEKKKKYEPNKVGIISPLDGEIDDMIIGGFQDSAMPGHVTCPQFTYFHPIISGKASLQSQACRESAADHQQAQEEAQHRRRHVDISLVSPHSTNVTNQNQIFISVCVCVCLYN